MARISALLLVLVLLVQSAVIIGQKRALDESLRQFWRLDASFREMEHANKVNEQTIKTYEQLVGQLERNFACTSRAKVQHGKHVREVR